MLGMAIGLVTVLALGAWGAFIVNVKTVERPKYDVVEADGDLELRDYPALTVAEVTRRGSRQQAVSAGFGPLARYIFAKARGGDDPIAMTAPVTQTQKIAMTAPVTQQETAEGTWTVRFIMPSEHTLETLPVPAEEVRLSELAPQRMAVIQFSGRTTDERVAAHEARLREWMEARELAATGPATYAYYDDPWMPGPLRRNEVMVPVAR
ncbi:MAG: heme-binding protein [Myxococcota bacterium]